MEEQSSGKPLLATSALSFGFNKKKKKPPIPKPPTAAVAAVFSGQNDDDNNEEEKKKEGNGVEEGEESPHPNQGGQQHQQPQRELLSLQKLSIASTTTTTTQTRADALREEGNVRAMAGDFRGGLYKFEEALALLPRSAVLYELKAQSHLQLEDYLEAVKAAQRAVDLDPAWGDAALTLGRALMSLGEVRSAVGVLSKLYGKDENNAEVRNELIDANAALMELRRREDDFNLQLNGRAGLTKQEEEVARAKLYLLGRGANVSSDCYLGGSEGSSNMVEGREEIEDAEEEEDMM